jgi:hypothetical protein
MSDDREIKWEYKCFQSNLAETDVSHKESRFNELGLEGWELVNVFHTDSGEQAWFKRRKASKFIRRER